MLSLNEELSEVHLLRLRETFHALSLFYLRTQILRTYARKNYATMEINPNGGFPLLRNFHVRTIVNFTRVDKIVATCGRLRVNVIEEPGSTFTFTCDLPYIASNLLRRVKCT